LNHGKLGWFHLRLDLEEMRRAAVHLLGEHDFSAFRSAECQAKTPVKTLHRADVSRLGDMVVFEFCANAFLHHMVRNLVGALVAVGCGKRSPDWIAELLAGRDRSRAAPTFSPAGLYFAGVEYESRWCLPGQGRIIAPLPVFQSP
jgi:tRNA pseudouridine38-40 synthase